MDGFLTLFLLNAVGIVLFYLMIGIPANRYKKRVAEAIERMKDTSVDKTLSDTFASEAKNSARKGKRIFWGTSITIMLVLLVAMNIYTLQVEPTADLLTWVILDAIMYGIAFIGSLIVLSIAFSHYYQSIVMSKFIKAELAKHPNSPVIAEVGEMIRLRGGEIGVSALSITAVVGSLILGVGYLVVLFSASQTAIECARSSKCI